jgi:hypothetical protein
MILRIDKFKRKTYIGIVAVVLFAITIAIPRLGQFSLIQNFTLVGVEESGARGIGGAQIFSFESGRGEQEFKLSKFIQHEVKIGNKKAVLDIADRGVLLNGEPLVVQNDSTTLISTDRGYVEADTDEYNFHDEIVQAPTGNIKVEQESSTTSRRAPTANLTIREIDFRAFSAPDFSIGKSDDEILSNVAKHVYLANQYLKSVNMALVLKEIKVYRDHQRFNDALRLKDPYKMLEIAADEHNANFLESIDVSGVFSNTFFPRANGLAYSNTSCINPHYSVLFVTQGGSSLSSELTMSSTLAHEVGHIVGMSHDGNLYPDLGVSVMAQTSSAFPFGFSGISLEEQSRFSALESSGGRCITPKISDLDTDQDDISDQLELNAGTDIYDPGSYPERDLKRAYGSWNGFKGQTSVGEVLGGGNLDNLLSINIRNLNGESITQKQYSLGQNREFDFIFSDLLPEFTDTYGTIEISSSSGSFSGLSNTYSHTGTYGSFNYISKQKFFKGSRSEEHIPFNSYVPFSFPEGSDSLNWLSVVNLNERAEEFELYRIAVDGQFIGKENLLVPAMGRRDVPAGGDFNVKAGSVLVRPKNLNKNEVLFHSFISRYYSKPINSLGGSVIFDGKIGSDVDRAFILDDDLIQSDKQSNTWLEISNSGRLTGEVSLTEFKEEDSIKQNKITLKAYQTVHLPLSTSGLLGYKISATIPYVSMALRYKGERQTSTVQRFVPHEYMNGTFSGSFNTFLSSSSYLYVLAEVPTKARVSCTLHNGNSNISRDFLLEGKVLSKVSLEGLFPEAVRDNYYKISCALNEQVKSTMFMGRTVDSKHSSLEAME